MAERPPDAKWLLGGPSPRGDRLVLRAGPLTAELEPETGFLRYVRLGVRELLRGIYAAVRDPDWGTVAPRMEGKTASIEGDRFEVRFVAVCKEGEIDFRWEGRIRGEPDGRIVYAWADPAYEVVHSSIVDCNRDLLKALRGEGRAETTGEDNLETMRLVFACYDSAARGEAVKLG